MLAPLEGLGRRLLAQLTLAGTEVPATDGGAEFGIFLSGLAQFDQPVHGAQTLEGILAVEQPSVVDLAQVPFDIGTGEGGAPEDDRDVGQLRRLSSSRLSRITSVYLTSSPLMPMASALDSSRALTMSAIPTLIPRFFTV